MNDFFKSLIDHLEGIMGFFSVIVALRVYSQSMKDKVESSKEKRIEIYMSLFSQWDDNWAKITKSPEKNRDLFKKSFNELSDENLRLYVINAVSLLARVHYYFEKTNQEISSEWSSIFKYVFSKNLFLTGYQKHEKRFSKEFKSYVLTLKQDNSRNILDLNLKKSDLDKVVNKIKESGGF